MDIDWTVYGGESEAILKPGKLDVMMTYDNKGQEVKKHIVDNETLLI